MQRYTFLLVFLFLSQMVLSQRGGHYGKSQQQSITGYISGTKRENLKSMM